MGWRKCDGLGVPSRLITGPSLYICRERVNAINYRDEVLQPIVVPVFQQDNSRPCTARVKMQFLHAMA